jgi:hypothetical protein
MKSLGGAEGRRVFFATRAFLILMILNLMDAGSSTLAAGLPAARPNDDGRNSDALSRLAILRVCVWRAALSISECKR